VVVVDAGDVGVDETRRARCEGVHALGDSGGGVGIVGVEPADDLSAGHSEALVQGVRLAPVRLRHPAQALVLAQDLERAVGRPAVDDDVLHRLVRLR
jgi:hypothetical protein